MKNPTLIGTAAACLMAAAFAAPAWSAPSDGMKSVSQLQPVWRTDVTGSRTEVVPLMKLVPGGSAAAVKLTGLSRVQAFDFGVRRDEVVSEATLDLSFTPSPALAPSGSQINFYLNGRLQRSVPISASMVGKPSQLTLKLSPKVIESVNQLTVEFIGHTPSVCENPADAAIWLDIAAESRLTLVKQRVLPRAVRRHRLERAFRAADGLHLGSDLDGKAGRRRAREHRRPHERLARCRLPRLLQRHARRGPLRRLRDERASS